MTTGPHNQFWLMTGSVPTGPFTVTQVHAELAAGRATWQTPACPVGGATWMPVVRTPGLGPSSGEADPQVGYSEADPPPSDRPPAAPTCPVPQAPAVTATLTAGQTDAAVGIAVLVVAVAALGGLAYGMYAWLGPATASEVSGRFRDAGSASAAKAYATPRLYPFLDALPAGQPLVDPNDKMEITAEGDGPRPGVKHVTFRGAFFDPATAHREAVEGYFRVVLSGGWKVDDYAITKMGDVPLPKPFSLIDDFHQAGKRSGQPGLRAVERPPGSARPLTDPPFQAKGVWGVATWFWGQYGVGGVVVLGVLVAVGMAIREGVRQKQKGGV